jgi:hypothetical protein
MGIYEWTQIPHSAGQRLHSEWVWGAGSISLCTAKILLLSLFAVGIVFAYAGMDYPARRASRQMHERVVPTNSFKFAAAMQAAQGAIRRC